MAQDNRVCLGIEGQLGAPRAWHSTHAVFTSFRTLSKLPQEQEHRVLSSLEGRKGGIFRGDVCGPNLSNVLALVSPRVGSAWHASAVSRAKQEALEEGFWTSIV